MFSKANQILFIFVITVVGLYFLVSGLVAASTFLAPLSIAILLTMVLIPLCRKMEGWGISRGLGSFFSVLLTMIAFAGLFFVISMQISNVADEWPRIKKSLQPKIEQLQKYVENTTGMDPAEQMNVIEDKIPGSAKKAGNSKKDSTQASGNIAQSKEESGSENSNTSSKQTSQASGSSGATGSGGAMGLIGDALMGFFSFLGTSLLIFIYMFFFLLYRRKIRKSILNFFSDENREGARYVLNQSVSLSQKYLVGRLLLIGFLAVLYSIGMTISGVNNAILISILAAVLSLVPYVGVIIGYVLAMAMAAFSGGDTMTFVGVTITYGIAQFVESYILEPYVVGKKVNLNPLVTILVVVVGGAVWGVTGMIISIPVFGIFKIVFDHIPSLKPLGYLLGEEDIAGNEKTGVLKKAANKIKKKF